MKNSILQNIILSFVLVISCQIESYSRSIRKTDGEGKMAKDTIKISYIGNMGVLLEVNKKTVLLDGLHEKYKSAYEFPTKTMVKELIGGSYEEYSEIEICLITHNHKDHFSPKYLADFLRENEESIIIGSQQIKKAIAKLERGLNQIKPVKYEYEVQTERHKGIEIKSIRCDHVNQSRHKAIENIAYLVKLEDYTILHVGDTHWDTGEMAIKRLNLEKKGLDIAILPYWMLEQKDSKEKIRKLLNPKKIIATHIPPNYSKESKMKLVSKYLGITVFTELKEALKYAK